MAGEGDGRLAELGSKAGEGDRRSAYLGMSIFGGVNLLVKAGLSVNLSSIFL